MSSGSRKSDRGQLRATKPVEPQRSSGELGEPERSGGSAGLVARQKDTDPEILERPKRRKFTREYKLRVLKEVDSLPPGEVSAFLRAEGLYSSHVSKWRADRLAGKLEGPESQRGPKPKRVNRSEQEVERLRKENLRLKKQLEEAQIIIEFQKKLSDILGIKLEDPPSEEDAP